MRKITGLEAHTVKDALHGLMDDAKAAGIYCTEAYTGWAIEALCSGESYTKEVEFDGYNAIKAASWMRHVGNSDNREPIFADFNAETMTLTFSRCPF